MADLPSLAVVIGSTRPGRAGLAVGQWFAECARAHGGFEVDLIDLVELALPLLDEPAHPRLRTYTHQHTLTWSARVERADALILVTPEYNRGYPAALKNALDYLYREWNHKPVGLVSYGGVAAGVRAVQQLVQVLTTLQMVPIVESVAVPFVSKHIVDGALCAEPAWEATATAMLDALLRLHPGLAVVRRDLLAAAT